jgi:hypothetical protein
VSRRHAALHSKLERNMFQTLCVVLIALLHCIVFATVPAHSFALIHSVLTNPTFVRPFYSPSSWHSMANSDDNEEATDSNSKGEIESINVKGGRNQEPIRIESSEEPTAIDEAFVNPTDGEIKEPGRDSSTNRVLTEPYRVSGVKPTGNALVDIQVEPFAEPPALFASKFGKNKRDLLKPVEDGSSAFVDFETYKKSKYFKEDPEKLEALRNGVMYIESIMQEFVDIEGSDGMKALMNVFDFEEGTLRNVVVRKHTE